MMYLDISRLKAAVIVALLDMERPRRRYDTVAVVPIRLLDRFTVGGLPTILLRAGPQE
jgi:hypothetical protein